MPVVHSVKNKMYAIVEQIRAGSYKGFSGRAITDIVNIGIGGSDLGPRLCIKAFKKDLHPKLNYHFISDAGPNHFENII